LHSAFPDYVKIDLVAASAWAERADAAARRSVTIDLEIRPQGAEQNAMPP
jgi:hypothetical protein